MISKMQLALQGLKDDFADSHHEALDDTANGALCYDSVAIALAKLSSPTVLAEPVKPVNSFQGPYSTANPGPKF